MAASIGGAAPRARPDSRLAAVVCWLVRLCALVPYALVALGLRLVIARVFFVAGQARIEGPSFTVPLLGGHEATVVLPAGITDATFRAFETQYSALPLPPTFAAYLYSYAEFVLPVCLVLGFATRLSALVLVILTALLAVFVAPDALWSTYVYWFSILLVLMSVGPGMLSVDRLIRHLSGQ